MRPVMSILNGSILAQIEMAEPEGVEKGNETDTKQRQQFIPILEGTGRFWYTDICMKKSEGARSAPEWRNTYESRI